MSSEIARLREQIALEEQAAQRVFTDMAAVAAHDKIITRMQQGADTLVELFKQGKDQEAFDLWNAGILEVQP